MQNQIKCIAFRLEVCFNVRYENKINFKCHKILIFSKHTLSAFEKDFLQS
jgi:hypothetical protein